MKYVISGEVFFYLSFITNFFSVLFLFIEYHCGSLNEFKFHFQQPVILMFDGKSQRSKSDKKN